MGLKRTEVFRQDAVRIALTRGLTRKQVADDLGVGMSTLNKWITAHPLPGSACLHAREGRHRRGVEGGFGTGSRE